MQALVRSHAAAQTVTAGSAAAGSAARDHHHDGSLLPSVFFCLCTHSGGKGQSMQLQSLGPGFSIQTQVPCPHWA